MKVFMGIMPDHDGSGLCNLAPETCREFALEIKAMCDAYNLDGIFLDEEYADYNDYNLYLTVPGFVRPLHRPVRVLPMRYINFSLKRTCSICLWYYF